MPQCWSILIQSRKFSLLHAVSILCSAHHSALLSVPLRTDDARSNSKGTDTKRYIWNHYINCLVKMSIPFSKRDAFTLIYLQFDMLDHIRQTFSFKIFRDPFVGSFVLCAPGFISFNSKFISSERCRFVYVFVIWKLRKWKSNMTFDDGR